METLDNRGEINGAQWQELDLKQEINTALSAYTASELAPKEKRICLKLLSCQVVGWETVSGHLFCYCWAFAARSSPWQRRNRLAHSTTLAYFTVVACFLLFLLIPQEAWVLWRSASDLRRLYSVNHVKINEWNCAETPVWLDLSKMFK